MLGTFLSLSYPDFLGSLQDGLLIKLKYGFLFIIVSISQD